MALRALEGTRFFSYRVKGEKIKEGRESSTTLPNIWPPAIQEEVINLLSPQRKGTADQYAGKGEKREELLGASFVC